MADDSEQPSHPQQSCLAPIRLDYLSVRPKNPCGRLAGLSMLLSFLSAPAAVLFGNFARLGFGGAIVLAVVAACAAAPLVFGVIVLFLAVKARSREWRLAAWAVILSIIWILIFLL